jgi:hypothetical protein
VLGFWRCLDSTGMRKVFLSYVFKIFLTIFALN